MLHKANFRSLGIAMLVVGCMGGCAMPKRTYQPTLDHNGLTEIEFVHYLSPLPTVSMDEACHAILLLTDGEDSSGGFEQRMDTLLSRGLMRESWGLAADDVLDKGTLAYMVVNACKLPVGLNDVMLGSWGLGDRRYALRAAIWHEMIPYGMPYHVVTGGELLSTITKAAEYMDREGMGGPPL